MRGEHLDELISALLDDELSPSEEADAYDHLASCPRCAAELADVRVARNWVRSLPAVDPPFGFFERIVFDASPKPVPARPPLRRRVAVGALAASAAAALALLGVMSPRDTPVSPSVARLVEAHATGASLDGDPLSRLAPIGVPVSLGR